MEKRPRILGKLSGLPNANARSQRFSYAISQIATLPPVGRTPKGAYSTRGRSRHLLETPFSEPLLRTLLRTLFYCKTHRRPPSQNPSENPFPRTLPRTFSEPFSERCVAVRPLRRAPYPAQRRAIYSPIPVQTRTFRDFGAIGPYEFQENLYGPIPCCLVSGIICMEQ